MLASRKVGRKGETMTRGIPNDLVGERVEVEYWDFKVNNIRSERVPDEPPEYPVDVLEGEWFVARTEAGTIRATLVKSYLAPLPNRRNSARHHLELHQASEITNSTAWQRSAAALRASCHRSPGASPRDGETSRK